MTPAVSAGTPVASEDMVALAVSVGTPVAFGGHGGSGGFGGHSVEALASACNQLDFD